MNFLSKMPNTQLILVISIVAIVFMSGGYSVYTKYGSITKESILKSIIKLIEKIKTQTNFSLEMKFNLTMDINNLYERCLIAYTRDNNVNLTKEQIKKEKKYYELISNKINDICEDKTIFAYVFDNDLFKYQNKAGWNSFKKRAIDYYNRTGKQILSEYYDDDKFIMPLREWGKRSALELSVLLDTHANQLLESIKLESEIYHGISNID